jgi:hypothetical protein
MGPRRYRFVSRTTGLSESQLVERLNPTIMRYPSGRSSLLRAAATSIWNQDLAHSIQTALPAAAFLSFALSQTTTLPAYLRPDILTG